MVKVIVCVALDIEMQSTCTKKYSCIYYVQNGNSYIILIMTTVVINKNRNFRHLMVLTVWLRIAPIFIYPTKEARANVVCSLLLFKFSPSINWTHVIRIIMNTQAINIGRQYVIGRSNMFIFEDWKKDIMVHAHGQFNILCVGTWRFRLCMGFFTLHLSFKLSAWIICKLSFCIVYLAPQIQHQWWHQDFFYIHKQHHHRHHHHRRHRR